MRNILIIGATGGVGSALTNRLHSDCALWTTGRSSQGNTSDTYLTWDATTEPFPTGFLPDRLDGLVYCPGSIKLAPFARLREDDFRNDFELNLIGAVKAIQSALAALKQSNQASIVLFSTVAVATGMPMHASIAAAKGAIEGLTRSLAAELAPKIRVNAIAPSLTDTPLAATLLKTDRQRESAAARHPLERIGQADDLAAAAAYLLSEESSWVTGQILQIDGGMGAIRRFT